MADRPATELGIEGLGPAVRIGSGGFADVYRAEQLNLRRQVAVKVLRGAANDPQSRMRFDRECQALGAVSDHSHIVGVHRSGFTDDGRAYLIMEFCPGGSLLDRIRSEGRMPVSQVIDLGIKIGQALSVAHDAGVLHRDVKPANVLLTAYGEPALADFGIARVDGAEETAAGQITASVIHAAPEILQGGAPTTRSDIYSLGSTMFELATGAPGHRRTAEDSVWVVMRRVLSEPHPDPVSAGIVEPLASVIRVATAPDPAHRFASVADLVAALATPVAQAGSAAPVTTASESEIVTAVAPYYAQAGPYVAQAPVAAVAADSRVPIQSDIVPATRLASPPDSPFLSGSGGPQGLNPVAATAGSRAGGRFGLTLVAGLLGMAALVGVGIGLVIVARGADAPPVTFELPAGAIGPLDAGDTFELLIEGGDEDTRFELLLDGEPIGAPSASLTDFTPESGGRHGLAVRSSDGARTVTTASVDIYVIGDLPPAGFRVNLASLSDRPANWATALARFDKFTAEGHTQLEILPSSRFPALRPGFWNLFVPGFGEDRLRARAYCDRFGLAIPDDCFVSRFDPGA